MIANNDLYDPAARRDTPLATHLKSLIATEGPIGIDRFMQLCLQHPQHGYYRSRSAIGATGDFITAPEISQIFGELLGLWCAVVWQQMGSPSQLSLIELGPGRGTLMADALRATRRVPKFHDALHVTLVETSETLSSLQRKTLADMGVPIDWRNSLDPAGFDRAPAIVLANEFLDALPVRQLQLSTAGDFAARSVALDAAGRLVFVPQESPDAEILTTRDTRGLVGALTTGAAPRAGLFIDYGHLEPAHRDTLQAVRAHKPEHPLTSPGEADLTTHVDFGAFAREATATGHLIAGPIVTQAEFLGNLGLVERAHRLMRANPDQANMIETSAGRLIAPHAMGTRFKVLGLSSPGLPPLPGFETSSAGRR